MLVIVGANGRTGLEVLRAALQANHTVRPVVRDDRDSRNLDRVIDVQDICYADADHPASLHPVLSGATQVISCIDPRTAGHEAPIYTPGAGANVLQVAHELGVERVLHLSVVGSYRWSPSRLNRASWRMDRGIRVLKDLPWSMIRVSSYFDEVLDGHVRPPDGRSPHRVIRHSSYSPVSRADVGRMVIRVLPSLQPSRTLYLGGPQTLTDTELTALIRPYVQHTGRRRTRYAALSPGDVSVAQESTHVAFGSRWQDRLLQALDPAATRPSDRDQPAVYGTLDVGPHESDQGRDVKVLRDMGTDLRRVVHAQLIGRLRSHGLPTDGVRLDFASARPRQGRPAEPYHGGKMVPLTGVRALAPDGELLHRGAVEFIRDELADEFLCWWDADGAIPADVWDRVDMGVKRRLRTHARWRTDPLVLSFSSGTEAVVG
jgi:uncharacterized protein YbjT (DUF2867 family)